MENTKSRTSRILGLLILFGIIGFAFWKFHGATLERIQAGKIIRDQTDTLSMDQKRALTKKIERIESRYGIMTEILITTNQPPYPERQPRTLYIFLNPERKASALLFPPLLENGLDESVVRYLKEDHFQNYWDRENGWIEALFDGLDLLWNRLRDMEESDD